MRKRQVTYIFDKKLLALLLVVIVFLAVTLIGLGVPNTHQDTRTLAAGPVCDDRCVHEIDCCKAVKANNDPYECAWPDRGWCFPSTCAAYEGQHTNCGWYWRFHGSDDPNGLGTNTVNGYGCMIGDSEATMVPICGAPTRVPQPTQRVSQPTPTQVVPTARPTRFPRPTEVRPPTPTSYVIPITATPKPNITVGPNPTSIIVYVTTTPVPEVSQPTGEAVYNTPPSNPYPTTASSFNGGLSDTLGNFFSTFISTLGFEPNLKFPWTKENPVILNVTPTPGPNVFGQLFQKISDFTKNIAP